MAEYNKLGDLFSDIADAIRDKTGDSSPIAANDFSNQIDQFDCNFYPTWSGAPTLDIILDYIPLANDVTIKTLEIVYE